VDNIKMNLVEIRWRDVDWIGLPQNRESLRALIYAVMNIRVLENVWKPWSGYTIGGLPISAQHHREE
jgi:hypothetical protein